MLPFDDAAAINISLNADAAASADDELLRVRDRLLQLDRTGKRFGRVLRDTFDQLLNGEETGRYKWSQLRQTEKTHAGSLVEINLHREFDFDNGLQMDYQIAGIEVDCKYSQDFGKWMIPPEAIGHLCLVVWASDDSSVWSAGLIRIREDLLNEGRNRDLKRVIGADRRREIHWIWNRAELPENLLLHLDPVTRDKILLPGKKMGQKRVNQLFRLVHSRRIGRGVVRTVAQQRDYMARVREGSPTRARPCLREEGIIILGDYSSHQRVARSLGGPMPEKGEFVAFKVARAEARNETRPQAELNGELWVVVDPKSQVGPAPRIPEAQERREI